MTQKLVLKNYQLEDLYTILFNLKLKGTDSRMRTRFIGLLINQLELMENERKAILVEYAKKDENGEVLQEVDSDGRVGVVMDDKLQYTVEVNELKNEDFIIEVKLENLKMVKSVTSSLLDADIELSGRDAIVYDNLCEIFESIDFEQVK